MILYIINIGSGNYSSTYKSMSIHWAKDINILEYEVINTSYSEYADII